MTLARETVGFLLEERRHLLIDPVRSPNQEAIVRLDNASEEAKATLRALATETPRTLAANETASRFIHLSCRFRGPSACADSRTSRVRLRRTVQGDHGASTVNAISCAISVTTAVPERTSPRGTASEFIVTMH